MKMAAAPAACGAEKLVPLPVLVPPPSSSEVSLTPGPMISTSGPKLENPANVSSVAPPRPPGSPSESNIAETVMTSSNEAGMLFEASAESFPAATTTVVPEATRLLTAAWKATTTGSVESSVQTEQRAPRLILATSTGFGPWFSSVR